MSNQSIDVAQDGVGTGICMSPNRIRIFNSNFYCWIQRAHCSLLTAQCSNFGNRIEKQWNLITIQLKCESDVHENLIKLKSLSFSFCWVKIECDGTQPPHAFRLPQLCICVTCNASLRILVGRSPVSRVTVIKNQLNYWQFYWCGISARIFLAV